MPLTAGASSRVPTSTQRALDFVSLAGQAFFELQLVEALEQ